MKHILSALLFLLLLVPAKAQPWAPAGDRIRTPWAAQVRPESPLPEYPRPQMQRDEWISLNGLWRYGITRSDADLGNAIFDGKILVPFALESSLSGIGKRLEADQALWYERTFSVPRKWRNQRILLHFEAVDYAADVFVNGRHVGSHSGGYTHFSFDITPFLKKRGSQQLTVRVIDRTDDDTQPRGKQVSKPSGIWYTSVSGIWQSVWMEPVPAEGSIAGYSAVADAGNMDLTVEVDVPHRQAGDQISVSLAGHTLTTAGNSVRFTGLTELKRWSPDDPVLYDLDIRLVRGGRTLDAVKGYTAFRSISVVTDADGNKRLALNGEPLFQFGPLDQGWWPDGLYTAPTDEALRYDIEKTKAFGFNMIRKHIKVEPSRWYWYCDKLGILVWQDMPCITDSRYNRWETKGFEGGTDWDAPASARATYYKEWGEIIAQLKNHPCIVVWVPFNEAWAQFETEKAVAFTREQDPTRLVNPASGGNFVKGVGDILDNHHYPNPDMPVWDRNLVNVLGEYGGIGLALEGHLWQPDRNWGYVQYKNGEEVFSEYEHFAEELIEWIRKGCSAAVYTQTTDVEIEVNGLMTYDRTVKLDEGALRELNTRVIRSMGR